MGLTEPYRSKYRSPLFTTISQVLSGLVTVRAYGQRGAYENLMFDRVDAFQGYDHVSANHHLLDRTDSSLVLWASTDFLIASAK